MRKYELTYLISDQVPENDLNKVTGKVAGFIDDLGGKVTKEDIWGRRKLVYPIKKQDFATYVTIYFNLGADKVFEFERDLRLTNTIMRHLLIVKDMGDEDMSLTAEEIAETAEIEEVIGGEKSFEMVEGETEESKDLMAVREEKNEEPAVEEETKEEIVEEKVEEPVVEEVKEVKKAKKVVKEKAAPAEKVKPIKKAEKKEDEAERLSKLNDELDDILKDEL